MLGTAQEWRKRQPITGRTKHMTNKQRLQQTYTKVLKVQATTTVGVSRPQSTW
eukprot:m.16289 g.16289  ORF g.16289 m.16289 type:complete len:53 (+) comp5203_c0_seq1:99-257(+)